MRVQIRYVILEVALIIGILLLGISSVGVLKNFVKIQFYCTDISYTDEDFSQYFYITQGEVETEEKSIKMDCSKKNRITVSRYKNGYLDTCIRIDPYNKEEDFGIEKITYTVLGIPVGKLYPEEIEKFIFGDNVDEVQLKEGILWFQAKDADPYVIFGKELTKHYDENIANMRVFLSGVFMLILYMLTFFVRQKIIWKESEVYFFKLRLFWGSVLLIMGILIFRGTEIALLMYGEIPISQLIFHIKVPLEGTNWSQFSEVFIQLGMQLGIVILVLALLGYIFFKKNKWNEIARIYVPVGIISICVGVINFSIKFDLMEYIQYTKEETSLYEDYYVDARDVDIIFPEKKRNLIYIYMESMETSYASVQEGGGKEINYIPELTKLVLENEQFSDANTLNGAYIVNGAGFTMGALAAQTTGVPINEMEVDNTTLNSVIDESEQYYLKGAYGIGDVLDDAGYKQVFMIGSEAKFAGRASFFKGHGNYEIWDYNTAVTTGHISSDYWVWWGYEDAKLYEYAKEKLQVLSQQEQPFNLTLLTVDTHFTDGYLCDLCEDTYEDRQYSNVLACASSQVTEFVHWIQEQDFYENTTIVLVGDHLCMDETYFTDMVDNYDRKIIATWINSPVSRKEIGTRQYSQLDMFPTTLATLGCQIEGNRLGLGVNLYSEESTLIEKLGTEILSVELSKRSKYYSRKLMYNSK